MPNQTAKGDNTPSGRKPWTSGPAEILQHGLDLIEQDTDTSRRLAFLSIDNAVELIIKTYLGLPKRVTGLRIGRGEFDQISHSFPKLLDALEQHVTDSLPGVGLDEVEWYHRLRNRLYHDGNGLTVEREVVEVYAEIARNLFSALFGYEVLPSLPERDPIASFLSLWAAIDSSALTLFNWEGLDLSAGDGHPAMGGRSPAVGGGTILNALGRAGLIDAGRLRELNELRALRHRLTHLVPEDKPQITPQMLDVLEETRLYLDRQLEHG